MKVAIVLGTRPEIVKMASVVLACEQQSVDYTLIHTGQHYSYALDQIFFEELHLPQPHHHLQLPSSFSTSAEQVGQMLQGLGKVLQHNRPDIVLVEGDTNSVLAGALSAAQLHIPVGHVEAGLRSYDRQMVEELNRVITDHLSAYLYAPTALARENAAREGIAPESIIVTGNTIVDAVTKYRSRALQSSFLEQQQVEKQKYLLVTVHRAENVDAPERSKLQSDPSSNGGKRNA